MKKPSILAVVPRAQGHTHTAVGAVLAGAAASGATTTVLSIASDGVDRVLAATADADAIVFGSPVYRATYAAELQQLLEVTERGRHGETTAPLKGKATAVVMTGASHHHFLSTAALRDVLATFFATQVLSPGLYLAHDAFDADGLVGPAAEQAAQHGAALHDLAVAVRASSALSQLEPQV